MRFLLKPLLIAALLFSCVACEASGSVKGGGGSDGAGYGRVKVGVPF